MFTCCLVELMSDFSDYSNLYNSKPCLMLKPSREFLVVHFLGIRRFCVSLWFLAGSFDSRVTALV